MIDYEKSFQTFIDRVNETIYFGNCSYYLLPFGNLTYTDELNQQTFLAATSFPGLYITNCTWNESEYEQLATDLMNSDFLHYSTDPFVGSMVSLSFVLCAATASSWMLLILTLLSPHSKPFFTRFAIWYHTIALTALLVINTNILHQQYMDDFLDVFKFQEDVLAGIPYNVCHIFFEAAIFMAWVQIVLHFLKRRYRLLIYVAAGLLLVPRIILWTVYAFYKRNETYPAKNGIRIAKFFFQFMVYGLFFSCVFYGTWKKRKYTYSRRVLPLAICTLMVMVTHPTFTIMELCSNWFSIWCPFMRTLTDIASCALVWEWVKDSETLEKRKEIVGVLGRRLSDDDFLVYEKQNERNNQDNAKRKGLVKSVKNIFIRPETQTPRPDTVSLYECVVAEGMSMYADDVSDYQASIRTGDQDDDDGSSGLGAAVESDMLMMNVRHNSGKIDVEEDVEEVEMEFTEEEEELDDDIYGPPLSGPQEGSSNQQTTEERELPPPFEIHPGFRAGDYWGDEKGGDRD